MNRVTSIEGIYENGRVRLLAPLPGVARARLLVTLIADAEGAPDPATPTANDQSVGAGTVVGAPDRRGSVEEFLRHRLRRPPGVPPATLADMEAAIARGAMHGDL